MLFLSSLVFNFWMRRRKKNEEEGDFLCCLSETNNTLHIPSNSGWFADELGGVGLGPGSVSHSICSCVQEQSCVIISKLFWLSWRVCLYWNKSFLFCQRQFNTVKTLAMCGWAPLWNLECLIHQFEESGGPNSSSTRKCYREMGRSLLQLIHLCITEVFGDPILPNTVWFSSHLCQLLKHILPSLLTLCPFRKFHLMALRIKWYLLSAQVLWRIYHMSCLRI